ATPAWPEAELAQHRARGRIVRKVGGDEPAYAERVREVDHVPPRFGRIAKAPIGTRDPIAEFELAAFGPVQPDTADQARRTCGALEHQEAARVAVGPARQKGAGILLVIGPGRAREVPHDRLFADRARKRRGILVPAGPQQEPVGACKHVRHSHWRSLWRRMVTL